MAPNTITKIVTPTPSRIDPNVPLDKTPRILRAVFVNGPPETGKSTFVAKCRIKFNELMSAAHGEISAIEPVMQLLHKAGYPVHQKGPKERALLSEVRAALEKYDHTPTKHCIKSAVSLAQGKDADAVIFIHCREPENIQRIGMELEKFKYKVVRVRVASNRAPTEYSNASDAGTDAMEYDVVINNDGTLEDLQDGVDEFIAWLMKVETSSPIVTGLPPLDPNDPPNPEPLTQEAADDYVRSIKGF